MQIFKKKTIFDVYNISPDDPLRYEKFCDEIASYDDRFYVDLFDSCIFFEDQLIHDRLTDAPNSSIKEQILSHTKNNTPSISFDCFKRLMRRIGVNSYTLEDYAAISAVCVNRELQKHPFLCNSTDVLASYIGYIDIKHKDYIKEMDELLEYKENYKAEHEKSLEDLELD